MGLDPYNLGELFNGGSPYYDMFRAGWLGIPLDLCVKKCMDNKIALRNKDLVNFNNGRYLAGRNLEEGISDLKMPSPNWSLDAPLSSFPLIDERFVSPEKRFFPCSIENKPLCPWGWKKLEDGIVVKPALLTYADAKALSPCGFVGQNLLYQRFIVVDIDGRGHGEEDKETIEFGELFKEETFSTEDPAKPGSFHLYFATNRLIKTRHFRLAKIDFAGNLENQAVYFKNKKWNGLPMMELNDEIWRIITSYLETRGEK